MMYLENFHVSFDYTKDCELLIAIKTNKPLWNWNELVLFCCTTSSTEYFDEQEKLFSSYQESFFEKANF